MTTTLPFAHRLDALPPGALRLAELCSAAVRVQPELLRSIRLLAAPHLNAGDESDLWWADIVVGRSASAMTIQPGVIRVLRARLRQQYADEPGPIVAALKAIHELHRDEPAAVRLEEQIASSFVTSGHDGAGEMEAGLGQALVSFVTEDRQDIADWWPGAWARLPDPARQSATAAQLSLATSAVLGDDAVATPTDGDSPFDTVLDAALRGVKDVSVGVLREGSSLSLGNVSRERGAAILVPDTTPRMVELEWQPEGAAIVRERIELRDDTIVTREVGNGRVQLRTPRGTLYDIPDDVSSQVEILRLPGVPPLGATFDGSGTMFAMFSSIAAAVELCLFDDAGSERRVRLDRRDNGLWQGYLRDVGPGQRYGYRVHGPYDPLAGHRCNPAKLLLDPYAKAIDGDIIWDEALFSYQFNDLNALNQDDSAPYVPKSVVINGFFDWADDRAPRTALEETVIYEAHVKGLTMTHPDIPPDLRGTYSALAHPVMIEHFRKLGITAVELMPVHQFVNDSYLQEKGLSNYWGYNSIGFFAPHNRYAANGQQGQQVQEFKAMVKALHAAGLEVILDVVFNHTAEGNAVGPTLSMRGIDNAAYYRLVEGDPSAYLDFTGTGNSLRVSHPHVLRLIMDSLRYWVTEMRVDGFRFDLASALVRDVYAVDWQSAFFVAIQQDPVVSQVKLIAEPWDVAEGGYQAGNFSFVWSEWNPRFRDAVRDFWRGEPGMRAEFATRLTGSADLYESSGRQPTASVNYITSHGGFTLNDLVSYNDKHNDANGEDGADGDSRNRSWNGGVEGPTDDLDILAERETRKRSLLATLLLSQGVPMISHGDEMGRTQQGNNNAYAQDNELSWVDWELAKDNWALVEFTSKVVALRHQQPVFRRRRFVSGTSRSESRAASDIVWFNSSGAEMTEEDWQDQSTATLFVYLNGKAIRSPDARGEPVIGDSYLLLFNAESEPVDFFSPPEEFGDSWLVEIDTAEAYEGDGERTLKPGGRFSVAPRSVVALRRLF